MPAAAVPKNDENADVNLSILNDKVEVGLSGRGRAEARKPLASVNRSPALRGGNVAPAKLVKSLEPSLQAWAASHRKVAPSAVPRNIGASEYAATPDVHATPELSVDSRPSQRSAATPQLTLTVPQEFNLSTPRASLASLTGTGDAAAEPQSREPANWAGSLRKPSASRSKSSGPWKPELTVPRGPTLHTEFRPRSRSVQASPRSSGASPSPARRVASTPERRCSSTPRRGLPAREQAAIEQHHARMCSASPARGRFATPSPARSIRSARGRSMPAPSPARSDCSSRSCSSRLSELSRPRSPTRYSRCGTPLRSTEELEMQVAEGGRRALKELLQLNSTTLCEALVPEPTLGSVNSRVSRMPLTVPIAPELRVETRSRSRSASVSRREGSTAPEMRNMAGSGIALREQAAIERHLELACMAHAQPPAALPLSQCLRGAAACPPQAEREAWIKAGLSAHDRAERARAMAREQREGAEVGARQRLCIFKPAAGAAAPTEKADAKSAPRAAPAAAEEHARKASGEAKAKREEAMEKDRARLCIFKAPTACRSAKQKEPAAKPKAEDVHPATPAPAMERVVRRSSRGAPAEACAE